MHKKTPVVLHIDGDNFFVSCELQRFPHLKGKPVIVGEERGIASAMSPEAKKLGITRGMPVFMIKEKYPMVHILPAHFELYEQYNQKMYDILLTFSDTVERYSIDECFAVLYKEDITQGYLHKIKNTIEQSLGITVSIGIAETKTLAKIASKKEKPSGLVSFLDIDIYQILEQTPIGSIWGIGRAISADLTSYNIHTAFDFIKQGRQFVEKNFGSNTLDTWYELQGIKRLGVESSAQVHHTQKSYQSTRSFGMSTKERSFLLSELCIHTEVLTKKLRMHGLTTNKFSYFIKKNTDHNRYLSTEIDIGVYTTNPSDLYKLIERTFDDIYTDEYTYKATGISIHNLKPIEYIEQDLFGVQSSVNTKNGYVDVLDLFEDGKIHLLGSLKSRQRRGHIEAERNKRNKFIYGLPLPYMGEVI
jgi:DNA polymerase-4/DNA polymerase V